MIAVTVFKCCSGFVLLLFELFVVFAWFVVYVCGLLRFGIDLLKDA